MLVDPRENRGTEQVLFNLIKYRPEDTQVSVIIPNISFYSRMESKELENRLNGVAIMAAFMPQNYYNRPTLIWPFYRALLDRKYIKLNAELRNKIKEFDVVYLFYNRHSILFKERTPILIGSEHTMPITGLLTGNVLKRRISIFLNKRYYDKLTAIHIFPSEAVYQDKILKYLKIKHLFSLPNGIDVDLFNSGLKRENRPIGKTKVFFVASLEYSKGFDIFIEVANIMAEYHNIEFHVVGVGPMMGKIKSFRNIIYHKSVTDYELSELYRDMDIFLYPTRSDTFSLVVLQALTSGLFVLTSKMLNNVFREFNHSGIEFVNNSAVEYVEIIKSIIKDANKINFDRKRVFELIKGKYEWGKIASKFYKEVESIYISETRGSTNDK